MGRLSPTASNHAGIMVQEIDFKEHRDTIARIRREAWGSSILHDIDEFDELAHHFALFDDQEQICAVTRLLRNDEVPQLELQRESGARDLVFPQGQLIMETSRGCAAKNAPILPLLPLTLFLRNYALAHRAAFMVSKSGPLLLPIYQQLGYKIFGAPFWSDWFNRETHHLCVPLQRDMADLIAAAEEEVLPW